MSETTTCAIVGGGPAGMVLGLMLARAGVQVTVLEKHGDFLRDFRGDTVHPTTMRLLDDLGLWERFAALPSAAAASRPVDVADGRSVTLIDFSRLRQRHPFIAMVPQWDLLNLLAEAGQAEPSFTLRMRTEVTGAAARGRQGHGVRLPGPRRAGRTARRPDDRVRRAMVGGSPRSRAAGPGVPVNFDVWWFRLPCERAAEIPVLPRIGPGKAIVAIPRRRLSADRVPRARRAPTRSCVLAGSKRCAATSSS